MTHQKGEFQSSAEVGWVCFISIIREEDGRLITCKVNGNKLDKYKMKEKTSFTSIKKKSQHLVFCGQLQRTALNTLPIFFPAGNPVMGFKGK